MNLIVKTGTLMLKGLTNYGVDKIVKEGCKQLMHHHYSPAEQICVELGVIGLSGAAGAIVSEYIDDQVEKATKLVDAIKEGVKKSKEEDKSSEKVDVVVEEVAE